MEGLIKLIELKLSPNAILNQDTNVWNQIQMQRFKFRVRFSVDRFTQSGNFENLLELNQTSFPKDNLILIYFSTIVKINKNYGG
jgi:hypothetical protein